MYSTIRAEFLEGVLATPIKVHLHGGAAPGTRRQKPCRGKLRSGVPTLSVNIDVGLGACVNIDPKDLCPTGPSNSINGREFLLCLRRLCKPRQDLVLMVY